MELEEAEFGAFSYCFPLMLILYSLGHPKTSHSNKSLSFTDLLANFKLNLVHFCFSFTLASPWLMSPGTDTNLALALVGCYDNTETVSPFTLLMLMGSM